MMNYARFRLSAVSSLCSCAGMTGFGNRSEWKQVDLLPEDYELLGFSPLSRALDLLQLNRDKNFNTDGWMVCTCGCLLC